MGGDRPPLARWSVGRVTLFGDSCCAMLPMMAQEIEDGATLARCLGGEKSETVPEALRHYEALRLPRPSRLQAMSRAHKVNFHLPDGRAQEERDRRMTSRTTNWTAGSAS